jgi:hypothetical protein
MTCLLVEGKRRGIFYLQRRDILYSLAYPGARYAGSSYCICELLKTSPGEYARCQIHGRRFHWDGKPGAVPKEGISDPIALSLSKGDRIIQNLSRFDSSPALRTGKLGANGVFLFGHPQVHPRTGRPSDSCSILSIVITVASTPSAYTILSAGRNPNLSQYLSDD